MTVERKNNVFYVLISILLPTFTLITKTKFENRLTGKIELLDSNTNIA